MEKQLLNQHVTGAEKSLFRRMVDTSFKKKPLIVALDKKGGLEKHLNLFDLLCIGIGGTVGTGIFALCGLIASQYAGPSVLLCWTISGFCCCLSGFSYMELSTRIPCAGSTYAYTYVALGELPAVIAGWCLTLEYGVSGAAVARSWADKFYKWLVTLSSDAASYKDDLTYKYADLFAGIIQFLCVLLLVAGISLGKWTVNFITILKLVVITFMVVTAFTQYDGSNLDDGFPPPASEENGNEYGWKGVLLGSTSAFFGFIGYDEVACLAAEAREPGKVMHIAVLGTIVGTTVLSVVAALSLVGMQSYLVMDADSAFGYAFRDLGLEWAAHITQVGELVTLPVVILIAFLAQPRLQYAMSTDGLLPSIFSRVDSNGNLVYSIVIAGVLCIALAMCLPFESIGDLCSAGVLVSFSMTNLSLIMIRRHDPRSGSSKCPSLLAAYVVSSGVAAFIGMKHIDGLTTTATVFMSIFAALAVILMITITVSCPEVMRMPASQTAPTFRAPGVPILPLLAIAVNWCMIAQLSWKALSTLGIYLGAALLSYLFYGMWNSEGNLDKWHPILIEEDEAHNCLCSICTCPSVPRTSAGWLDWSISDRPSADSGPDSILKDAVDTNNSYTDNHTARNKNNYYSDDDVDWTSTTVGVEPDIINL